MSKFFDDMKNTIGSIEKQVAGIRKKIQALVDERRYYASSPLPVLEVFQRVDIAVDEALARGEKNLSDWLRPNATINILDNLDGGLKSELLTQALAEQIKTGLHARLEALSFEPGPPAAERKMLIETTDALINKLAVEEEKLIMDASDHGVMIKRRLDFDPAVVLELEE